jgi:glycosyltransferase involved in cell wall biosynthesis
MTVEISLCTAVWNTSHLLKRSIYTYMNQDLDPNRWELIIIDDNSLDDVKTVIAPLEGKINIRYVRLDHGYGMRGNTISFNTAFEMSQGNIIAETTPECMLPPDALSRMLLPHYIEPRCFVALKTHNLTPELQLMLDTVDWKKDLNLIRDLPGWSHAWVHANDNITHFGTHQICSIKKSVFYEITERRGFPLFCDYGSEDPWYSGLRERKGIKDITLPNSCMAIHQWHLPFQYWISKGYGPNLNFSAHSKANYMDDKSGHVPPGGSCTIWDKGIRDEISQEQKLAWRAFDDLAITSGISKKIVEGIS